MNEKKIEEIVLKVFDKAKKEHASHSRYALSNYIANTISEKHRYIHPKTLERAYDRYIDKKKKHGPASAESIDLFCKYLKKEDYKDYLECNPIEELTETVGFNWKWITTIVVVLSVVLLVKWVIGNQVSWGDDDDTPNTENTEGFRKKNLESQLISSSCMTWADSLFVAVACDIGPYSKYGTKVESLDKSRLTNMKKVQVTAAYDFFTDDDKPLVWYYKNNEGEIEYFTAPGLHPTNGETLRKITTHIIKTYVPLHRDRASSFIP